MDKLQENLIRIVLMLRLSFFKCLKNILMGSLNYLFKQVLREPIDFLKTLENIQGLPKCISPDGLSERTSGREKNLLACIDSGEAQVLFFNISGSEFVELYIGAGVTRVRKLFDPLWNKAEKKVSRQLLIEYGAGWKGRAGVYPDKKRSAALD